MHNSKGPDKQISQKLLSIPYQAPLAANPPLTPALLRLDPVFGTRENLKEAVAMVLQANRELAEESLRGAEVVREPRH
jgi:hypothetical protein